MTMRLMVLLGLVMSVLGWHAECSAAPKVQVLPDVAAGVYELGTTTTWTVSVMEEGKPVEGKLQYAVLLGGLKEVAKGELVLEAGKAQFTGKRDDAGTLLAMVKFKPMGAEKELVVYSGTAYAPEKIVASAAVPEDFDAFWKAMIAELDAVPMDAKLERIDVGDDKVEYYKITLGNIRGTKIYGQIAKPAGKSDLPALLQVQWAGVYPLQKDWVLGYARQGWLAMNISAHDLPIDEKEEFYQKQAAKELNDYPGQGNDDRETSYFLRMFLSCRRAVDFLTQHPDWKKDGPLVVHGGSQGGYQAIVTAGIHSAVTALAASVPAGCDHTGKQAGRAPGWPNWASRTWQGKDEQKMRHAARYFDAMNFATKIKCPALVGIGLADTACPAEGILATCNQMHGEKQIILMPLADHGGDHRDYHAAMGPFLEKQKQ